MKLSKLTNYFYVPVEPNFFLSLDKRIAKATRPYAKIAKAFRHNLNSIIDTLSVPFFFGYSAIHSNYFQRMHIAERIRARKIESDRSGLSKEEEKAAYRIAVEKMETYIKTDEGRRRLAQDLSGFLSSVYRESSVKTGVTELHRQGIVLLWGTLEMFARDLFEVFLNSRPNLVKLLFDNPSTKRLFNVKAIPFEELEQMQFNLSKNVGTYLLSLNDLNDLAAIKEIYKTLFPKRRKLWSYFSRKDLWTLYQQRNLIVHRRSIIDKQYLNNTGESIKLGTELKIPVTLLDTNLELIRDLGGELMIAVMK